MQGKRKGQGGVMEFVKRGLGVSAVSRSDKRLGEILVERGKLSQDQLDNALRLRGKTERSLGEVLMEFDLADEQDVARALAQQYDVDFQDLADVTVDPPVVGELPRRVLIDHSALPISKTRKHLVVAFADPREIDAIRKLPVLLDRPVKPVISPKSQVMEAIAMHLEGKETPVELEVTSEPGPPSPEVAPSVTKLVDTIMASGIKARATDIHFDPHEDGLRVRYRIDGILHDTMNIPLSSVSGVLTRLKVLGNLDITERRHAQDGRIGRIIDGREMEMRVSTVPTSLGERVVIRVLGEAAVLTDLSKLGLEPNQLEVMKRFLAKPYGMVLVVGPVGAGKTTTLYSCLNLLKVPTRNLMTIEDPVEYRMKGVNQLQVNYAVGFDFVAGLRALLRQDPDVIMVGEIRDEETARISTRAAMTGVMMLSTIHANDAPSTITALYQQGIPGFLVSQSLLGVVAQRLVRRNCPHCRRKLIPDAALLKQMGIPRPRGRKKLTFYKGKGCEKCFYTGYLGRTGIFEIMEMNEELKALTFQQTTKEVMATVAKDLGMQTLKQSALNKVMEGTTSVEEFFRVAMT